MYQTGITCTITNNYNSDSVRLNTRNSFGIPQDNVYALNGNQGGLQGNTNQTIGVIGTVATINCDTFKSNAPFECGYLQLGTPITAKPIMILVIFGKFPVQHFQIGQHLQQHKISQQWFLMELEIIQLVFGKLM